jgi:formate/nitrite transporter FocA (FNT family)
MIMYIAVKCYKLGSIWGIFIGVPLFILAGFQHSIANVITAGVAVDWSWTILLCAVGNFVGSVVIAWLAGANSIAATIPQNKQKTKKAKN